jgi:hypothetical protein
MADPSFAGCRVIECPRVGLCSGRSDPGPCREKGARRGWRRARDPFERRVRAMRPLLRGAPDLMGQGCR